MIRKITLSLLACMAACSVSLAQKCGFDIKHQQLMAKNPAYASSVNQFNTKWVNWQSLQQSALLVTLPSGKQAWEIPVVVHVMYTTEKTAYNVSDAQIQNLIDYLNKSFQATWPTYPDTTNGGTRMHMVFKLAKRDPNCQATTGIIHYNVTQAAYPDYYSGGIELSTATGEDETVIKALSLWPNTEYYNIWIVNKIDGADGLSPGTFTAGYAYFPGAAANIDGTVILASQAAAGDITLPHEIGHAFNLYHVFQGGTTSSCPPTGPGQGDLVADTEPQMQSSFNCPTGTNTCTGLPYANGPHNFMDYSNCQDRFTPGQRSRVNTALDNTVRASLKYSLGATPLPATSLPTVCVPSLPSPPSGFSAYGPRTINITQSGTNIFRHVSGGYTDDGGQHYINNACKYRISMNANTSYNMTVGLANLNHKARVYIDYNNDGVFNTSNEQIYTGNGVSGGAINFNFTTPLTGAVYCTPLRMRVIADQDVPLVTQNACGYTSSTVTNYMVSGQAEDYEVVLYGAGNTPSTGIVTIQDPPIEGNPSCAGTNLTLAAKRPSTAGITPVWYGWYRKSLAAIPPITTYTLWSSSTTDSTWNSAVFQNLDSVFVKVAYPGICGIDTTISDTITLYRPTFVAPAVTITGPTNDCPGATVTYTATPTSNPGQTPSYVWQVNGITQPGASGPTFSTILANNSTVKAIMTSSSSCASPTTATSNTITFTEQLQTPTVQMALTTGTNPGCTGQSLTFTVINSTFAGTAPTYQWKVNGTPQLGATGTSFSTSTLSHGDLVSVEMTSNSTCAATPTVQSNVISIIFTTINADVTIAQVSGNNPACSGHPAIFAATPINGGPVPQYQWLINSTPIIGANSQTFNTSSLGNNDVVQCILVSSDPCVVNTLDTSSGITMQVTQSLVPTVSFSMTKGNNPGCLDSLIEFTATATNIGTNPNFDWFVNGFGPVFNGDVFTSVDLLNGDVVTVRANQTDGGCYLPDTVFSAPVTMTLSPTPDPPIISLIGNNLVTNRSGAYVWYGPGGQLTNSSTGTYHPTVLGQYWCVTDNNGCWSKPSNKLTITLLDINTYNIEQVEIFPNPTAGQLTLDWKHSVNMKIDIYSTVGQKLMEDEIRNQAKKTLDLSKLANGIYFVVITDEQGKSGTARITVNK